MRGSSTLWVTPSPGRWTIYAGWAGDSGWDSKQPSVMVSSSVSMWAPSLTFPSDGLWPGSGGWKKRKLLLVVVFIISIESKLGHLHSGLHWCCLCLSWLFQASYICLVPLPHYPRVCHISLMCHLIYHSIIARISAPISLLTLENLTFWRVKQCQRHT